MTKDEIVLYEVSNFKGSNFYCPDCFNKHPDSKDWIKKVYTQRKPFEKGNVVCCECKKELVVVGRSGEGEKRKEILKNFQRGVGSRGCGIQNGKVIRNEPADETDSLRRNSETAR